MWEIFLRPGTRARSTRRLARVLGRAGSMAEIRRVQPTASTRRIARMTRGTPSWGRVACVSRTSRAKTSRWERWSLSGARACRPDACTTPRSVETRTSPRNAPPASARARFVCVHSRRSSPRSIDPNARSSWISMPSIVRDAREFETRDEASLEIDRSTPPNPAVSRARALAPCERVFACVAFAFALRVSVFALALIVLGALVYARVVRPM